jgi:carbon monoxide dehydrogenase subunit G
VLNLSNSFRIAAPVAAAWDVLQDFPMVARCMPGAELHEVRGDELIGSITVRLGPMKIKYEGVASVVEQDTSLRRIVSEGSAKDRRGGGTAKATVSATLVDDDGGTVVNVETELAITGRPAQMGQGLIQDVAEQVINQFADRLQAELSGGRDGELTGSSETEDTLDLGAAVAGPLLARAVPAGIAIGIGLCVAWLLFRKRR